MLWLSADDNSKPKNLIKDPILLPTTTNCKVEGGIPNKKAAKRCSIQLLTTNPGQSRWLTLQYL